MGKRKKKSPSKKSPGKKRYYEGARFSQLNADWVSSGTSADSEIVTALRTLRNRSRDLCRNTDYVSGALDFIVDNVVGQGSKFQSQVKMRRGDKLDETTNDLIEKAWEKWCCADWCHVSGKLTFGDIERLILREIIESGEILIRLVRQPFGKSTIPLALEVIECDQLYDNDFSGSYGANQIRMGIELDEWMRPVAYHLYEHHPGDYQFTRGFSGDRIKRVPAEEIIHLYITKRANQTRGVPWLHPSLVRSRHLGKYEEAELVKARMQALISAFIESPEPDALGVDDEVDGARYQDWQPGDINHLSPGEKFVGFNPTSPNPNYGPYIQTQHRGISAGLGLSYESYSNDFTNTSYSSARTSRLKESDRFKNFQGFLFEHFHSIVYPIWLNLAVLSDTVKLPKFYLEPSHYCVPKFFLRGWQSVDPYKESQANLSDVQAGFKSITEILAERGRDIEDVIKQRRRELDLFDQYGISTTTNMVANVDQNLIKTEAELQKQNLTNKAFRSLGVRV